MWVNILYWMRESRDLDFRHTLGAVSAVEELELFRAYKAYYDQLRREVHIVRGHSGMAGPVRPAFPAAG